MHSCGSLLPARCQQVVDTYKPQLMLQQDAFAAGAAFASACGKSSSEDLLNYLFFYA
jgi:hypothetical protein